MPRTDIPQPDSTQYLQSLIDYQIKIGHGRVRLPAGRFRISDSLYLKSDSLCSVVFEGEGYRYRGSDAFSGTAIFADFWDRPAIVIQGARGSVIRGVSIIGPLFDHISSNQLGTALRTTDDTDPGAWCPVATAESQFNPLSGIAIDNDPNGKYSSDVLIEDCEICGFVVGIVNQPCNADANGDFTSIRRVQIAYCKYGISVGNSQSRNVSITDVKMACTYTCLTNNVHGSRKGKLNGTISNLSVGACINIIQLGSSAYFGPLKFLHLYAEQIWRIGDYQAHTANENSLSFDHCHFNFSAQTQPLTRGIPASVLSGRQQPINIEFTGCTFTNYPTALGLMEFAQNIAFRGCSFEPTEDLRAQPAWQRVAQHATMGGVVLAGLADGLCNMNNVVFDSYGISDGQPRRIKVSDGLVESERDIPIPLYATHAMPRKSAGERLATPARVRNIGFGDIKIDIQGRNMTFSFNEELNSWMSLIYGPAAGDVIWDSGTETVFWVESVTQGTVVAIAQTNYRANGTEFELIKKMASPPQGILYIANSRFYTPSNPVLIDCVRASKQCENVGRDDGYSNYISTEILAGDALYIDQHRDFHWPPSQAIVTEVSPGPPAVITFEGASNQAHLRKRLVFWIRK